MKKYNLGRFKKRKFNIMTPSSINLKDALINSCNDLFSTFGIEHKFICELPEKNLNITEEINVVLGFTEGLKGNLILCLTNQAAIKIVSGMMGGAEVNELDDMGKSAISEFANMLGGSTIMQLQCKKLIDISPPNIVKGQKEAILINNTPSKKMFFKLADTKFSIAYSAEEKAIA